MSTLPPLPLIREDHFCISGKVTIHPSAAIAPGVLLQADPGSEIIIAAGVCIGAGSILHAHGGMLEIRAGAILGAGVLAIGSGCVGENACVGSNALIWNASVEAEQVVPAGARLGDSNAGGSDRGSDGSNDGVDVDRQVNANPINSPNPSSDLAAPTAADPILQNPPRGAMPIYGKSAVNQLLASLFPSRQPLNGSSSSPSSD